MYSPDKNSYWFRIESRALDKHSYSRRFTIASSWVGLPVCGEYDWILFLHSQCMVWERSTVLVIWFCDHHVAITSKSTRSERSVDLRIDTGENRPCIAYANSCKRGPQFVFVGNELRLDSFYLVVVKHGCILIPYARLRYAKTACECWIPCGIAIRIDKNGLKTIRRDWAASNLDHIGECDFSLEQARTSGN